MATLKTLIVDDEPGIRSGINRILRNFSVGYPFMDEDFDFDAIDAATGEEAIEILNSQQIDIVLLDNKLPGMDGIDVLEYINKKQMDLAVMMITSYASLELAIKATNNGAYNFVPKPFTPDELRSSIENIAKHLFLKRMTRRMQEEGKQIRFQFLSVLSHELKSPLNAVEGYLKMMQERQVGDKLDDYEKMIDRSLVRIKGMRSLIMDLLDLTKLESGKKQKELKKIDLNDVAKMAIDTMEPYAIQRNVKVNFDPVEDATLTADVEEMEIIFNNLISNAIKYNKDGGQVNVFLKPDDLNISIRVEDTGIGMSEEELSNIFQEFVRIKNQKTRQITGSGLGLSIVKKLTEEYGGDIHVKSKPDVGSTFTVILPGTLTNKPKQS
ncbi:MAG: response regulator [Bacteroidales bacterium]|nr:response regulator [Bacteroidales bacterium]MCF8343373.1 response regulator [Bacteroidales bacterium]MCF8375474.1 response regulator [Bacteroidales bacterium]MCF8399873.1 response regulator [Bacteroidales bacterium]